MERHVEKCVEVYCELAKNDMSCPQRVASPCVDDHLCADHSEAAVSGKNWTT